MIGFDILIAVMAVLVFDQKCVEHIHLEKRERLMHSTDEIGLKHRFYGQYLRSIKLNDKFIDFSKQNMDNLMKDTYDAYWRTTIDQAKVVSSLNEIPPNSPASFKIFYE